MPSSVSATIFDQFDAPVGLSHQPELPTKLGTGYTCIKILLLSANLIFVVSEKSVLSKKQKLANEEVADKFLV